MFVCVCVRFESTGNFGTIFVIKINVKHQIEMFCALHEMHIEYIGSKSTKLIRFFR